MGNYASTTELWARYASTVEAAYATDTESTGVPSETVGADVIGGAEGWINGYLSVRYLTPVSAAILASNPETARLLKAITLDRAEANMQLRSPKRSEMIKERMAEWKEFLMGIAAGRIEMPGAAPLPTTASAGATASWSTWDRGYADGDVRDVSRASAGAL